jgi:hypothetical protein
LRGFVVDGSHDSVEVGFVRFVDRPFSDGSA